MSSLSTCLRKASKVLSETDTAAIREIYNDYVNDGQSASKAADRAISEYIGVLNDERTSVRKQAEAQGAVFSEGAPKLKYSVGSKTDLPSKISIIDSLYGAAKGMLPGMTKKHTIKDLANILSARTRKLNRGKTLSAKTDRNKDIISETIALEVTEAMKQTGHAGNWYSQVLVDAMNIASTFYPELNTDPQARTAFLLGMAITSNGMTVSENARYAVKVYASYKRNGKFPDFGSGKEEGAMKKALKLANELKEKWGMNSFTKFLNTEFTVGELKTLGLSVNGENIDTLVYGSAIFGPKVGQAFFQNLSGNFTPLTMDRWWMRTWGRMVGNLASEGMSSAETQMENFRVQAEANPQLVEAAGFSLEQVLTDDKTALKLAVKIHKAYAKGNFKDRSDFNKTAKTFDMRANDPIVAPRNGTERNWIREVVAEAQRKLAERGVKVDTASMQALLWYPEKEFYLQNGVGNERSKPTDYATEISKIARRKRISQSAIGESVRRGRAAGDVGPANGAPQQASDGAALSPEARQLLIQDAALEIIRQLPAVYAGRDPKGAARELNGAPVVQVYKPVIKAANKLKEAGLASPTFAELAPSQISAKVFSSKLKAARKGSDPTQSGLESMRLFLSPDGKTGFAMDGDQVVAMFKDPSLKEKGAVYPSLLLAVQQGARTLTVEEGVSSAVYARVGFTVVASTSDTNYLVYDDNVSDETQSEPITVDSEAEAIAMQDASRDAREPNKQGLRYRLEDEPDTPMRTLGRVAQIASDQGNTTASSGSVVSWVKSKMEGKNAANYDRSLAMIPRRNLKDFVREGLESVGAYLNTANRMDGRTNELFEIADDLGKRWSKYTSKHKSMARILGELMHSSTLLAVDPSKPYKPLKKTANMTLEDKVADAKRRKKYSLLSKYWNKLDTEGQAIYNEVRDSYASNRVLVEAAIDKRINESDADPDVKKSVLTELRKQFEAGRVTGPYFPLARFGELWASAKDANGEVVAFSKFETTNERREWASALRKAGYAVDTGKTMNNKDIVGQVDPKFATKVAQMAKGVDVALADEIWQLYLSSMPEMSMRKAFIHRKGRLGFSNNAIRSFGHTMFHGAHQIAKLEYGHVMEGHLDTMRDEVREIEKTESPDALWANAVAREMSKRHEWAMKPTDSGVASKLTALGFAWYLGATPAAALVNLSQTAIVAFPVLAAKFSWAGAGMELNKAAALWAGTRGNIENRLRGDERAAMDEARKVGVFSKTQGHDLAGLSESGNDYTSKMTQTMGVVSWMFHKAEQANREITFLAGYRLGRKDGMSHEDAIVTSENLVWDSHFDYNSTNRPRLMQNDAARVILLFRQYSLNMTYRLARDFRESFLPSTATKQERSQARQRLGGIMMMTSIFAGVTGQPLAWAVSGILDALLGDDDEPFDSETALRVWLTEQYGAKAAEAIVKGPTDAFTGVTMSSRVSLSHLWIREAPRHLEGSRLYDHYIGEVVGPVLAIPKDILMGTMELADGKGVRALERFVPKAAKDTLKALRYLREGALNQRGDVILSEEELTTRDSFSQAIGFTPAKLTMQYEQNRATGDAARAITDRRSSLMDRLFLSWRQGDSTESKNTMEAIGKFNIANPSMKIKPDSIISSAKSRASYSERSVGGLAVPPALSHLHRKNKFTPDKGE
jgi:hypothetical protein